MGQHIIGHNICIGKDIIIEKNTHPAPSTERRSRPSARSARSSQLVSAFARPLLAALLAGATLATWAPAEVVLADESRDAAREKTHGETTARAIEGAYQFALAKLLAEESAFREAEEAFQRAIELDDSDPYGFIELAIFHRDLAYMRRSGQRDQLELAASYSEQALARSHDNHDALRVYGQIHLRLGEYHNGSLELALDAFERLRELVEGDLQTLTSLGQIYLWQRQPEKAAEVLEEAVAYVPNHRMVQTMLVDALYQSEQMDKLDPALERLVVLSPEDLEQRLKLAELRSDRGDHAGAADALRDAPPEIADDERLRRILSRELHLAGENAAALKLLDELLAEDDDPRLRRLRAAVLVGLVRYEEAIAELRAYFDAAEGTPSLQDQALLVRLLERVDQPDAAAEILRGELGEGGSGRRLQVVLTLAGVLERHDRAAEAVELLENELASELGKVEPKHVTALAAALAEIRTDAGLVDEALAGLERAVAALRQAERPEEVRSLELHGLALLARAERHEELLTMAKELEARSDEDLAAGARQARTEALVGLGRVDEALELFAASKDGPGSSRQRLAWRVSLLFDNDREAEAAALIDQVASSDEAADLFFAAQLYQGAERYAEAAKLARRVLEKEPESIQALFLLSAASERQGEHEAAVDGFKKLLVEAPDHAPSLNYLGYMWAEKGENLEAAHRMILRAVALDPDSGAYVESLGWVEYQLGRHEEARRHLEWAARLLPTDPTIHEHLGDVYLALGDPERARKSFLRAVELEGENVEAVRRKLEALDREGP